TTKGERSSLAAVSGTRKHGKRTANDDPANTGKPHPPCPARRRRRVVAHLRGPLRPRRDDRPARAADADFGRVSVTFLRRFQPIVYVRLTPDLLSVRDVRSGRTIEEPPLVAIARDPKKTVLGVGAAARTAAATQPADVVNPFKHPRTLFSDFTAAE